MKVNIVLTSNSPARGNATGYPMWCVPLKGKDTEKKIRFCLKPTQSPITWSNRKEPKKIEPKIQKIIEVVDK